MPSKNSSNTTSKTNKKNKFVSKLEDDDEEFYNSEDDYVDTQSGGADPETDDGTELDSDSANLDIDPDDERDPIEDDKYDPVEENEQLDDPDEEEDDNDENEGGDEEIEEGEAEGEIVGEEDGTVVEGKPCHVKNLNKDFIVLDEDDSNMYGRMEQKKIPTEERESGNIMTYYEMVRIIGTRAQQFNFGSPPLVEGLEGLHPAKMAYLELLAKMTPFIIKRRLPGKKYEEWRIDELDLIHEINDDFFVPEKFDFFAFVADAAKKSQNTEIYDRTSIIAESGVADKTGKMERIKKTKKSNTVKTNPKKSNTRKSGSK